MKIVIMRHGEAEHYALNDAARTLTERGRKESISVAVACNEHGLTKIDKVLVSPYQRAQETWKAIAPYYDVNHVVTCDDITPYGQAVDLYDYLLALAEEESLESILLVSHLPLVSYLAAEFITNSEPPIFPTSGVVAIDFDCATLVGRKMWSEFPS